MWRYLKIFNVFYLWEKFCQRDIMQNAISEERKRIEALATRKKYKKQQAVFKGPQSFILNLGGHENG